MIFRFMREGAPQTFANVVCLESYYFISSRNLHLLPLEAPQKLSVTEIECSCLLLHTVFADHPSNTLLSIELIRPFELLLLAKREGVDKTAFGVTEPVTYGALGWRAAGDSLEEFAAVTSEL
jgi:hypothetical protein